MLSKNHKLNPTSFIAIGVCYMGVGVALSLALYSRGASGVGTGLIGIGVVFLLIGVVQKRRMKSGKQKGDKQGRPRAQPSPAAEAER